MSDTVIAYEPVWGMNRKNGESRSGSRYHAFTRAVLKDMFGEEVSQSIRIQYGGSVKPENTKELMSQIDVDGALVVEQVSKLRASQRSAKMQVNRLV